MKIVKGAIVIGLQELCESLSDEDRRELLTNAGFDQIFLTQIVDQLAEGMIDQGNYWFDHTFYNKLRERLVEVVQPMSIELIRGLIQERDRALAAAKESAVWIENHYWNKRRLDGMSPVEYVPMPSEDAVKAFLDRLGVLSNESTKIEDPTSEVSE